MWGDVGASERVPSEQLSSMPSRWFGSALVSGVRAWSERTIRGQGAGGEERANRSHVPWEQLNLSGSVWNRKRLSRWVISRECRSASRI